MMRIHIVHQLVESCNWLIQPLFFYFRAGVLGGLDKYFGSGIRFHYLLFYRLEVLFVEAIWWQLKEA